MSLRDELVRIALAWQESYGVAPAITSALSEYDAAILIGMPEPEYCLACANATAVRKGFDFAWRGVRYQVKANRRAVGQDHSSRSLPKRRIMIGIN